MLARQHQRLLLRQGGARAVCRPPLHRVASRRCLAAARAGGNDKSWGEIATEAADVVK